MRLFDAHCHLQDKRLAPTLDAVMARAREAGVVRFACCGCAPDDWARVAEAARRYPGVTPAYGLHPWYAARRPPDWKEQLMRRLTADPRAGVGEIGLDHAIEPRDEPDQADVFMQQLALARDLRRPASLHCRRAWNALLDALRTVGHLPAGFVVHSFSGSAELVAALLPLGARFSFSGSCTYPGNRRVRKALAASPLDRLLIETDSPDLLPFVIRTEQPSLQDGPPPNEPAHLRLVLAAAAELKGTDQPALAERVTANAEVLFNIRACIDGPLSV